MPSPPPRLKTGRPKHWTRCRLSKNYSSLLNFSEDSARGKALRASPEAICLPQVALLSDNQTSTEDHLSLGPPWTGPRGLSGSSESCTGLLTEGAERRLTWTLWALRDHH